MKEELVAPCGMNCSICIAYFGERMDGGKRKKRCTGCRIEDKKCAFLKKKCELLSKKKIKYCFECRDFPCRRLKTIDKRYENNYAEKISFIENLKFIRDNGIDKFLKKEEKRWKKGDKVICVHNGKCYQRLE